LVRVAIVLTTKTPYSAKLCNDRTADVITLDKVERVIV
jgi:hypothetical protein